MSYKNLDSWKMSQGLVVDIHEMTVTRLPKFEMYEEGSQLRRAIKWVKSNIVEGHGRRRYIRDYIRFLIYAHASCDEAKDHLETLHTTGSLNDDGIYRGLHRRVEELSKALNSFISAIDRRRDSVRDELMDYGSDN